MTLPQNYINRMKSLLKNEFDAYLASLKEPHHQGLRSNDLKIDASAFQEISPFDLEPIPWVANGFYSHTEQPAKHPYYHAGLFYIQEPSAMLPGSIMPINPGDKVLDLCAAPGGKTTQLGARLKGTGLLVSNDISPSRSKAIVKNVELFGIKNAIVLSEAPQKLEKCFEGFFDKVLVDAPCSGEGMFRKDIALIKNWEIHGVDYYVELQKEILPSAAIMLKPGGIMVYSTCTFSVEENEDMIQWFLTNHSDFEAIVIESHIGFEDGFQGLTQAKRLWPHKIRGEGHFVAMLHKRENNNSDTQTPFNYDTIKEQLLSPYLEFEKSVLKHPLDHKRLTLIQDKLYLMPEGTPNLKGLRVLRSGWYIGDLSKGRFEPSQAFASGLRAEEVKKTIHLTLNDLRIIKYLKGETIDIETEAGYHLICVEDYPLGWAKKSGNILKNKYCTGWRWQ